MKLSFLDVAALVQPLPEHPNFKNKIGTKFHNLSILFYVGKTPSSDSKYACQCDCGNYTIVSSGNLRIKGVVSCGCTRKAKHRYIDPALIQSRVDRVHNETVYNVVDFAHGGVDRQKWTFLCGEHGEFKADWSQLVVSKMKCPGCAKYGFNQTQSSYFYLHDLYDGDNLAGLKYGITKKDIEIRRKELERYSEYNVINVLKIFFDKGSDALALETEFSRLFGRKYVPKEALKIGFTETISPLKRQEAINYIKALSFNKKLINQDI